MFGVLSMGTGPIPETRWKNVLVKLYLMFFCKFLKADNYMDAYNWHCFDCNCVHLKSNLFMNDSPICDQ